MKDMDMFEGKVFNPKKLGTLTNMGWVTSEIVCEDNIPNKATLEQLVEMSVEVNAIDNPELLVLDSFDTQQYSFDLSAMCLTDKIYHYSYGIEGESIDLFIKLLSMKSDPASYNHVDKVFSCFSFTDGYPEGKRIETYNYPNYKQHLMLCPDLAEFNPLGLGLLTNQGYVSGKLSCSNENITMDSSFSDLISEATTVSKYTDSSLFDYDQYLDDGDSHYLDISILCLTDKILHYMSTDGINCSEREGKSNVHVFIKVLSMSKSATSGLIYLTYARRCFGSNFEEERCIKVEPVYDETKYALLDSELHKLA